MEEILKWGWPLSINKQGKNVIEYYDCEQSETKYDVRNAPFYNIITNDLSYTTCAL
jgi:hypothetical protein